jgi:hypothetical protein
MRPYELIKLKLIFILVAHFLYTNSLLNSRNKYSFTSEEYFLWIRFYSEANSILLNSICFDADQSHRACAALKTRNTPMNGRYETHTVGLLCQVTRLRVEHLADSIGRTLAGRALVSAV